MRQRDEDGFTLVELLLSAAILTIIMGAITGALITFLKNGTYTIERDDHTGGAVVLSSYLNRDLASSDGAPSTASTPCSGAGTAVMTMSWTEWTATPTDPTPVPGAGTWRSSYVVTPDPVIPVGGGTRYQLVRRLCPPTGAADDSLLLRNLGSATPVTVTTTTAADCPAGRLSVTLPSYAQDIGTQGYSYSGCLRGRLG